MPIMTMAKRGRRRRHPTAAVPRTGLFHEEEVVVPKALGWHSISRHCQLAVEQFGGHHMELSSWKPKVGW
jgi:hypothetical protein